MMIGLKTLMSSDKDYYCVVVKLSNKKKSGMYACLQLRHPMKPRKIYLVRLENVMIGMQSGYILLAFPYKQSAREEAKFVIESWKHRSLSFILNGNEI